MEFGLPLIYLAYPVVAPVLAITISPFFNKYFSSLSESISQ